MELPLEAQLIVTDGTAKEGGREELRRAQYLAALDRYLKAVGLRNEELRHRFATRAFENLRSHGPNKAQVDWERIIAAVDQILSAEHGIDAGGDMQIASRGRIAQRNFHLPVASVTINQQLAGAADWGVPVKCPKPMPEQELTVRRPKLDWRGGVPLWRFQAWRPAHSLMLGLFCLAVVLVP